jgi:diguanylate cyclase (GGDEF)-like protein/PAS domain S-box-containing protein
LTPLQNAPAPISVWSGAFHDASVERRFRADGVDQETRQARALLLLAAIVSALFMIGDLRFYGDARFGSIVAMRSLAIAASLVASYALTRLPKELFTPTLMVWQGVLAVTTASLVTTGSELALAAVILLPILSYLALPLSFRLTVIAGTLTSALLLGAYLSEGEPVGSAVSLIITMTTLNVALAAFTSHARHLRRREWLSRDDYRKSLAELAVNREFLERTFMAVPVPLLVTDATTGAILQSNEATQSFLSLDKAALDGRSAGEFYGNPDHRQAFLRQLRATGFVKDFPTTLIRDDGVARTVLLSASKFDDRRAGTERVITAVIDETERKMREARIAAADIEYHALFDNCVVGIYRTTVEGRMLRANAALVALNGYKSEAELIAAVNDISSEWYVDPQRRDAFKRLIAQNGVVHDFVSEVYRHKSREPVWISENAWSICDPDGNILWYEGMVVESTARVAAQVQTEHLAMHDPLTGLANRARFGAVLAEACARADREPFALFCIDLDRFKAVNDAFGHPVGDGLLIQAADRLSACCRPGDVVCRLGGDEFTIIQTGLHGKTHGRDAAAALARRILEAFSVPFEVTGHHMLVGASIGIAAAPFDDSESTTLVDKADKALYCAKMEGKNTYRFATPYDVVRQQETAIRSA